MKTFQNCGTICGVRISQLAQGQEGKNPKNLFASNFPHEQFLLQRSYHAALEDLILSDLYSHRQLPASQHKPYITVDCSLTCNFNSSACRPTEQRAVDSKIHIELPSCSLLKFVECRR